MTVYAYARSIETTYMPTRVCTCKGQEKIGAQTFLYDSMQGCGLRKPIKRSQRVLSNPEILGAQHLSLYGTPALRHF